MDENSPKSALESPLELAGLKRAPAERAAPDCLPVRMLNEYAYCPRLGYMMWVQGEFADNVYTEDGRYAHRRVDVEGGKMPSVDEDEAAPRVIRSAMLSSEREQLIARVDLLEVDGARVVPVDYKRGKKPEVPEGAYEPERVQVCAQGLILRDNGFSCNRGVLYFAGSRERVEIGFTEALIVRTRQLALDFRAAAERRVIPPPLDNSPKCNGCSLVGICLPDETGALMEPPRSTRTSPRRLTAPRDDALPVYVQNQGAYVSKSGDVLIIKEKGQKVADAKLFETSNVTLMGNVQISTQAVQELCRRNIPVVYTSYGGWFYGMASGPYHKNIDLRLRQYGGAEDPQRCLTLARGFVSAKIRNCRTMLRRNAAGLDRSVLNRLRESAGEADTAATVESLLGVEGYAARVYFGALPKMMRGPGWNNAFSFEGRNRRPPLDPVNAMLSLAYSLLVKDLTVALTAAGFDPYLGFFHKPRYGRPSLALDLMEEFRPIVCDSVVIGAINNGVLTKSDFIESGSGVALKSHARKSFIAAYERRMSHTIRHPVFGYEISYRRVLDVQARLLGRYLTDEIPEYPKFLTR